MLPLLSKATACPASFVVLPKAFDHDCEPVVACVTAQTCVLWPDTFPALS
jgi:hypothetical protein